MDNFKTSLEERERSILSDIAYKEDQLKEIRNNIRIVNSADPATLHFIECFHKYSLLFHNSAYSLKEYIGFVLELDGKVKSLIFNKKVEDIIND